MLIYIPVEIQHKSVHSYAIRRTLVKSGSFEYSENQRFLGAHLYEICGNELGVFVQVKVMANLIYHKWEYWKLKIQQKKEKKFWVCFTICIRSYFILLSSTENKYVNSQRGFKIKIQLIKVMNEAYFENLMIKFIQNWSDMSIIISIFIY